MIWWCVQASIWHAHTHFLSYAHTDTDTDTYTGTHHTTTWRGMRHVSCQGGESLHTCETKVQRLGRNICPTTNYFVIVLKEKKKTHGARGLSNRDRILIPRILPLGLLYPSRLDMVVCGGRVLSVRLRTLTRPDRKLLACTCIRVEALHAVSEDNQSVPAMTLTFPYMKGLDLGSHAGRQEKEAKKGRKNRKVGTHLQHDIRKQAQTHRARRRSTLCPLQWQPSFCILGCLALRFP